MELALQHATVADAPVLAAMNRQLADDERSRNSLTVEALATRVEKWLGEGWQAVLFLDGSQTIGYALFQIGHDYYDASVPEVYIRQFFVARDRRRQGIGRHGMQQQLKIANAYNDVANVQALKQRMASVIQDAQALHIAPCLDRNNHPIGIGKVMPSITDLVGLALDRDKDYRILSMMAHCQVSALQQLGFKVVTCSETGALHLDKQIQPEHVFYLCNLAFTSYTKQLWCLANLFGLNVLRLEEAIEDAADELKIDVAERFWRAQQVPT